jgi:hypothetical protein
MKRGIVGAGMVGSSAAHAMLKEILRMTRFPAIPRVHVPWHSWISRVLISRLRPI